MFRLARRSCVLGLLAGFTSAVGLGCVFYVEDTQCGPNAYDYRGACYCEEGYDGDDPAGSGCAPVMSVRVTDDCDDGDDVGWKLFSDNRDWTWPSGTAVYVTPGLGYDGLETIICDIDEWVCFGAETDGGLVYGVGLDNSEPCDDCCYPCESRELDLGYLTCN
ncbi:hypothetical protein [Enhygromyxa salina]|nr:hypothetical protein [Enhygromyxa salina]